MKRIIVTLIGWLFVSLAHASPSVYSVTPQTDILPGDMVFVDGKGFGDKKDLVKIHLISKDTPNTQIDATVEDILDQRLIRAKLPKNVTGDYKVEVLVNGDKSQPFEITIRTTKIKIHWARMLILRPLTLSGEGHRGTVIERINNDGVLSSSKNNSWNGKLTLNYELPLSTFHYIISEEPPATPSFLLKGIQLYANVIYGNILTGISDVPLKLDRNFSYQFGAKFSWNLDCFFPGHSMTSNY